jgi:low temperature requirement protein LtrA
MSSVADRLLRPAAEPRGVVYLELFFDLAFLLSLTRLSSYLQAHLNAAGGLRMLLLLAAVFWVWFTTTVAADWYDPNHRVVQATIAGTMFASLLMAAAVPEAFGDHALLFAAPYVAVHTVRGVVLLVILRGHRLQRRSLRITVWFLLTGVLWIVGALVPAARTPLWTVAALLDLGAAPLGWPLPGLGRIAWEDLRTAGSRLAERLQQLFLIAIGELILLAGVTYSEANLDAATTAAFALTFVNAALLALIYYTPAGRQLGPVIDRSEYPASVGQEAAYLHLALIAAVIASAVGDRLLIADPTAGAKPRAIVVTLAGTALFLVTRILLSVVTYGRLSLARLAGFVAVLGLTPAAFHLPSLAVIAIVDLVLAVTAVSDFLIERGHEPLRTAAARPPRR